MPLFTKLKNTPQIFVDIITNSKHTGRKIYKILTLTYGHKSADFHETTEEWRITEQVWSEWDENCIKFNFYFFIFFIVAPCILVHVEFTHQQMHFY